jgi:hypothetical protein
VQVARVSREPKAMEAKAIKETGAMEAEAGAMEAKEKAKVPKAKDEVVPLSP